MSPKLYLCCSISHIVSKYMFSLVQNQLLTDHEDNNKYIFPTDAFRREITSACWENTKGFLYVMLKSSLLKLHSRHYDLVNRWGISVSQMTTLCSFPHSWLIIEFPTRIARWVPQVEQDRFSEWCVLSFVNFLCSVL